ncbi:hypothetical protein AB6A40_002430 [Gnathostoma spinigerum]|uniref:J domain-containing protein n=1 Tax=Gnathostoma spinigerum TaxID=75299 RepID=A0ABD6E954_9BILA
MWLCHSIICASDSFLRPLVLRLLVSVPMSYYDVLGVSPNASSEEIKNAFYTLSKKYHPDVTCDDPKHPKSQQFLQISTAYETLKDKAKRKKYDLEMWPYPKGDRDGYPFPETVSTAGKTSYTANCSDKIRRQFRFRSAWELKLAYKKILHDQNIAYEKFVEREEAEARERSNIYVSHLKELLRNSNKVRCVPSFGGNGVSVQLQMMECIRH